MNGRSDNSIRFEDLEKIGKKDDGKNIDDISGKYRHKDSGEVFFVKNPGEKTEFFTELLAGLIIKGLIEKEFIPKEYADTVIVADAIESNDKYFLIQPFTVFENMSKLLGNVDNKGRKSVVTELYKKHVSGIGYESILDEDIDLFHGLSYALMIKLFLADSSVHDGNIGIIDKEVKLDDSTELLQVRNFVGLDLGAAFRYISKTNESDNIFTSLEEKYKLFNFTKKYFDYYGNIEGLFEKMNEHAEKLYNAISAREIEFREIISDAVNKTFECYLQNYDDNPAAGILWAQSKEQILDYILKDDIKIHALLDDDVPEKITDSLVELLILRAEKIAVELPKSYNPSREKPLISYSSSTAIVNSSLAANGSVDLHDSKGDENFITRADPFAQHQATAKGIDIKKSETASEIASETEMVKIKGIDTGTVPAKK